MKLASTWRLKVYLKNEKLYLTCIGRFRYCQLHFCGKHRPVNWTDPFLIASFDWVDDSGIRERTPGILNYFVEKNHGYRLGQHGTVVCPNSTKTLLRLAYLIQGISCFDLSPSRRVPRRPIEISRYQNSNRPCVLPGIEIWSEHRFIARLE